MKILEKILQEIEAYQENYGLTLDCSAGLEIAKTIIHSHMPDDDRHANMTAEEAWEIARKLTANVAVGGYSGDEMKKIFGSCIFMEILLNNTAQEAKAKIEAWEAARFDVGDVVRSVYDPEVEVMVTKIYKDGYYNGINAGGAAYSGMAKRDWKKTGRHIDIDGLLRQIGGDE